MERKPSYASEYGDPDGIEVNEKSRFQTQQHLRLRSDQEHQADSANNRILNKIILSLLYLEEMLWPSS